MSLWNRWRGQGVHGLVAIVLAGLAVPAGAEAAERKARVAFRIVSAAESGIGPIMEAWKAAELKRQGGKFRSHGWWPWGLTAFDIDGDGDLDLMPSHHGTPRAMILRSQFRQTEKLTFADATRDFGVDTRDLPMGDALPHVWDFDGDGWLDIAGFSDESKCPCLFNQGGRKLVVAGFNLQPLSYLGEVRDLNGDGYPDVTGQRSGRRYTFLFDPKARTFRREVAAVVPPADLPPEIPALIAELRTNRHNRFMRVAYLAEHDLNGDGRPDRVVRIFAGYSGTRMGRYLIAGENGTLADRTEAMGLPPEGTPVLVDDVSGDGAVDVLIASAPTGGLYLGDGRGKFALQAGPLTDFLKGPDPYAHKVHAIDLDNDTDPDLVVEKPRYGQLQAFENIGDGVFLNVLKAKKWDAYPTAICDINDDGLVDVVAGGPGKEEITIYLNATAGAGGFCKLYPRMAKPNWAAIGARVEVFRAGHLGRPGARPYQKAKAHIDARPVHIGLGAARAIDLRTVFPGRPALELKNVKANNRLTVSPDGILDAPAK